MVYLRIYGMSLMTYVKPYYVGRVSSVQEKWTGWDLNPRSLPRVQHEPFPKRVRIDPYDVVPV